MLFESFDNVVFTAANSRTIAKYLDLFLHFPSGDSSSIQPDVTWFLNIRQPGLISTDMQEKVYPIVGFQKLRMLDPEGIGLGLVAHSGQLISLDLRVWNYLGPFGLVQKAINSSQGYPLFVSASPGVWKFETVVLNPQPGTISTYLEQELSYTLRAVLQKGS